MTRILLHQWEISPFCGKIRKILKMKGLPFEVVNYNGLRASLAARLSPVGKLPVLEYEGDRIQDSTRIAEFLDKHHPMPALYPEHPEEQARALILEDWADESLYWYEVHFRFNFNPALNQAMELICEGRPRAERWMMRLIAPRMLRKSLKAQGLGRQSPERIEADFIQLMENLNALLEGRLWLVGDSQSIADIAVSAQLDEMIRTSHVKSKILSYPNIKQWLGRM